jgi:hypothetical protein
MLGATVQNLVARQTWHPEFVKPCSNSSSQICVCPQPTEFHETRYVCHNTEDSSIYLHFRSVSTTKTTIVRNSEFKLILGPNSAYSPETQCGNIYSQSRCAPRFFPLGGGGGGIGLTLRLYIIYVLF